MDDTCLHPAGDPLDDDTSVRGHGTRLAGIIGAVGNNTFGIAGVNWQVKLLPIKIRREPDRKSFLALVLARMDYLIAKRQQGVNIPLGHISFMIPNYSQALQSGIDAARDAGILLIWVCLEQQQECRFGSALPLAGSLVNKISPKALLAFGIIVNAYATYLMSNFNLSADFYTVIWPRIVLGIGMGFFFIPLTTMTMSGIRKEDMGNASAIYNLLRNLGGSFGVAFVTTMLSRRPQFHQNRLVENLTPFDSAYQMTSQEMARFLQYRGFENTLSEQGGLGLIYREILRQASMLSFNDAFRIVSIIMICVLPLVFLLRREKPGISPGMH